MNKSIFSVIGVAAVMCVGYAFGQSPAVTTFTDSRDKKVYKKVKIDKQTWMAENLNYAAEGSKCYENNAGNCEKYGRLYDWNTAQKVCPAGWHLPSSAEWTTLKDNDGGLKTAGKILKSTAGWNENGNGTNEFGFSALPGGRGYGDEFDDVGRYGNWWSASEQGSEIAWNWNIYYRADYMGKKLYSKSNWLSVRCVQD